MGGVPIIRQFYRIFSQKSASSLVLYRFITSNSENSSLTYYRHLNSISGNNESSQVTSSSQWKPILPLSQRVHQLPNLLASLSKFRLSSLVVITTIAGFQLSPLASLGWSSLLGWTALGVTLSSFSANAFNQWLEAPFDSQMGRTRARPLPTHQLGPFGAFNFALLMGIGGVGLLAWQVGAIPATLAGLNILLYAALYTPLKRMSVINTWVGAIVGAIPPVIGWVAGGGHLLSFSTLGLAGLLYCWQFPHFNSLSWKYRGDYSRAGYCMASVLNPRLSLNSALRHALATIPCCALLVFGDNSLCNGFFLVDSTIVNLILVILSTFFWWRPSKSTAKRLFFYSLWHLPILLALMIIHKKKKETVNMVKNE